MKVFKNDRTLNNNELPVRKGSVVPDGAVNLAWYKSPDLNPTNNLVVVDSTRFEGPQKSGKFLAYANTLGILEDEYGNQAWPEEFPVVGDKFLDLDNISSPADYLPYAHVSRYFHIDYAGLTLGESLTEMDPQPSVRVVDVNNREYLDGNGEPAYKIYVASADITRPDDSRESAYRIWVFLDMNPAQEELFLVYNKVEIEEGTDDVRNQQIGYKEPINAKEYYHYLPEESEVVDRSSYRKQVFSTSPIDLKDQVIGRAQPTYKGWQIQVPKKAIPDPRKYELFRWRVACEYSREIDPAETTNINKATKIKAGVVTFNSTGASQSRANYIFAQLNESSFNTGGIDFINPLKENVLNHTDQDAEYWHVPINDIEDSELEQFDILIWAPSSATADFSLISQKVETFTKTHGGTFIIETSSRVDVTEMPGVTVSNSHHSIAFNSETPADRVTVADVAYYDYEPATPDSSNLGMYETWPPTVEQSFTANGHSSDILRELNFLGGWDLDSVDELKPSAYKNMSNVSSLSLQYISELDESEWETVIDSKYHNSSDRYPVLARRKYTSGGSMVFSTGCFFEDHVLDATATLLHSTFQVPSLTELYKNAKADFSNAADSSNMEGEMKLRVNLAMLSTAFRPSPNNSPSPSEGFSDDADRHSVTLYSDWQSDWVINAHNDVLSSEEKAEYNFALLPKKPDDQDPVWMKILSDKTIAEIMDAKANEVKPELLTLSGLKKRYAILVTNSAVETYPYEELDGGEKLPAVWTYSFSPPFNVPVDGKPYAIREEMIAGTGVGEGKKIYPPKPYKVKSTGSYVTTKANPDRITVTATVTGTARRVYKIPAKGFTRTVWIPGRTGHYSSELLRWSTDQDTSLSPANYPQQHFGGIPTAKGIETFTDSYYIRRWTNNWAYWGNSGTYTRNTNPRGYHVINIQRVLNQFAFFGMIPGPPLREDGYYGSATANRVLQYQYYMGAIYKDGKIDAETWGLIGYGLVKLGRVPGWFANMASQNSPLLDWARRATDSVQLKNTSSLNNTLSYYRQSWATNGPRSIREQFLYTFDPNYSDADVGGNFDVCELRIKAATNGANRNNDFWIDWLDVRNNLSFASYNAGAASHGNIKVRAKAGQWTVIPFSPRRSNSISFRALQDQPAGWGSARSFGIDDVAVLAKTYIPGQAPVKKVTVERTPGKIEIEDINVEYNYTYTLKSGIPQKISTDIKNGTEINGLKITTVSGNHNSDLDQYPSEITEIRLNTCTITPASKSGAVTVTPAPTYRSGVEVASTYKLLYNNTLQSVTEPTHVAGPNIGDGSTEYYAKSAGGAVEPFPRSYGWVNKEQGILLITDQNGRPFGFPAAVPQDAGKETNFARLVMDSWEVDQTIHYGFYDTLRNQWVENQNGEPDISYYDYVRRGPDNVYMAVQTTYEFDGQSNLPPSSDPVFFPSKTAMPVYGVKTRNESSVKLRNPSAELSHSDVWPVLIGTGGFTKKVTISNDIANSTTTFLKDYGNKTLTAHYILRDGFRGPWSDLLGRPYRDTIDERPRLLSDDTIIVNNAPIASIQEPTLYPSPADPMRPFFTVYRRETFNGPWTEVPLWDIKEYNLNKGIITLSTPLKEQDSRLVKVSYTSRDYTYRHKYGDSKKINLNPYIMQALKADPSHIAVLDKPIYVYLKPSFVVENEQHEIISETHQDDIVGVSFSNTIFNPQQADYDPLAYRLGIIFVTSSMQIDDLAILDTRVRGGGAQHHLNLPELGPETRSYWDAPADRPYSYQRGGFAIVRLPQEITEDFAKEEDLRSIIDRNMTAGVAYELQNLAGEPLVDFTGSR